MSQITAKFNRTYISEHNTMNDVLTEADDLQELIKSFNVMFDTNYVSKIDISKEEDNYKLNIQVYEDET